MQKALLLLLLTSCIAVVQVPVTEPPEIILPAGPQEIVFVSRFDTAQISFTEEKVTALYKECYQAFVEGLQDGFKSIEHLSLNMTDTAVPGRWYTSLTPEFPDSTQVIQLIKQYKPNYLMTLDAFKLDLQREEELIDYGDGAVGRRVYYYIDASAALALYDQDGQVADKMLMNDQQYIDNRSAGILQTRPNIGDYGDLAGSLVYDLGYEYALMFVEYDIFVTRYMYKSKQFKQVIDLVENGQWEDARKALLPLTEHPNQKIAQQAAQNMAVVAEALGNLSEIAGWQQKAQSKRL